MTATPTAARHVIASLVLALVLWPGLAGAQSLVQMQQALRDTEQTVASLRTAIERQRALNDTLSGTINKLGAQPPDAITLRELQQAQFDVDIARTRLVALDSRLTQQTAAVNDLNRQIMGRPAREARPQQSAEGTGGDTAPQPTLATVVDEAALELRGRQRAAAGEELEQLRTFRALSAETLSLNVERLAVLRNKIQLSAIDGLGPQANNPIIIKLRHLVGTLVQENINFGNEAAELESAGSTDAARIALLRLRADEALLRSNVRLNDIAVVEGREIVNGLRGLVEDPAIPVRLFRLGDDRLSELGSELQRKRAQLSDVGDAVADIRRIAQTNLGAANRANGLDLFLARIGTLLDLIETQRSELGVLTDDIVSISEKLTQQAAVRDREALATRSVARLDDAAQRRLWADLEALPAAVEAHFIGVFRDIGEHIRESARSARIVAVAASLALVALALYLRQNVLRRFVNSPATQATAVPVEVVRRNLLWLLPAGIWYLVTWAFDIPSSTTDFFLVLLLIPAAAIFVRDFVQVIVVARTDGRRQKIGRMITRLTELTVLVIAIVILGYFVVTSVFLLPSTEDWIGRLSYTVLVIAALPLLLFAWYFAAAPTRGSSLARRALFATLSLLPPVALIGVGLTGIVGYTALATQLFINLAQVIIILSILALALGVLYDVIEAWTSALRARDPARAYFWRRNFLMPLSRALTAVLILAAVRATQLFFGWNADTPGVGDVIRFFETTLFNLGGTDYTVGRIIFGAAAIWLVFWIASWSRRVSYSLFYLNISDLGIRQSLSVFTQYLVVVVGLLVTLTAIGFDVTTLTVFAASLGVGIGFGMQNVVNNFISGLLLLVERPLRLGDIVTVAGDTGTVEQIGIRSLRLKTFDEYDVIVPNSAVISDTFTNWSRTNKVIRQLVSVGIAYDDDPEEAVRIVREIVAGFEPILKSPAPQVTVDEFGDSSVNIRVAYYIMLGGPVGVFDIRNHVFVSIWKAFRDAGITIPFPQRDLHIIDQQQPGGEPPKTLFAPGAGDERTVEPAAAR